MGGVYKTDLKLSNNEAKDTPYLSLKRQFLRFGFSLTTVDLNHDGIDDLVVSAPAEGPGGPTEIKDYYPKSYYGSVYVYLGKKDVGILENAEPDYIIRDSSNKNRYLNLGFKLRSGKCNKDNFEDLIILSPFSE